MLTKITGDLFTTEKVAFGHGVNCKGYMGSGIAVPIRNMFPENFKRYEKACQVDKALKPGMVLATKEKGRIILNIASQNKTGRDAQLPWLEEGLRKSIDYCNREGLPGFAIPRIGAGIGGLDWKTEVEPLLHDIFDDIDLELEVWTLPEQVEEERLEEERLAAEKTAE